MNKSMSRVFAGLVSVIAVISISFIGNSVASADAAPRVAPIKSNATGECLDDSENGLRMFSCNGMDYQDWDRAPTEFPYVELQNMHTGKCMDFYDEGGYGLRTNPCNRGAYQFWLLQERGGIELRTKANNNKCLDASGLGLRMLDCNGGEFQRFTIG